MQELAPIRVVLADLPGFGRSALAQLVTGTPGAALVASVGEPGMIEPALQEWDPDAVIVDDRLLGGNGSWVSRHPAVRVIVVGVDDDPGFRARAERIGAEAWVAKDRADAILPLLLRRLDRVGG